MIAACGNALHLKPWSQKLHLGDQNMITTQAAQPGPRPSTHELNKYHWSSSASMKLAKFVVQLQLQKQALAVDEKAVMGRRKWMCLNNICFKWKCCQQILNQNIVEIIFKKIVWTILTEYKIFKQFSDNFENNLNNFW